MGTLALISITQILAVVGLVTILRWTIKVTRWATELLNLNKGPSK